MVDRLAGAPEGSFWGLQVSSDGRYGGIFGGNSANCGTDLSHERPSAHVDCRDSGVFGIGAELDGECVNDMCVFHSPLVEVLSHLL